ncbi:MAG: CPBP family intramembrane metalloprotease [Lachnospiraceae bacterium]|nr:CPBP family intramembrane metalloprotease [Lachnospiraceae bacterium]
MELVLSNIETALINLFVFSIIPLLWWNIKHRKQKDIGFFRAVGFTKPHFQYEWWTILAFAVLYFFCYSGILSLLFPCNSEPSVSSSDMLADSVYTGIGIAAIIPAIIENFIANGIGEELFFRGFLLKRFSGKFGITTGLILQAVLFGALHNMLYLIAGMQVGFREHLLVFVGTSMVGLMLGWLNEKIFSGSIIPSILLHGLGNFTSSIAVAFGVDDLWGTYSCYIILVLTVITLLIFASKKRQDQN